MKAVATLAFSATLLVSACAGGGAPQPTPVGTPAATVAQSARNTAFEQTRLEVPADQTFAIDFTNYDSAPHNVSIHGNGSVRTGETFGGPADRTYVFAGLPAGTYTFQCDVHPNMSGTLVVD